MSVVDKPAMEVLPLAENGYTLGLGRADFGAPGGSGRDYDLEVTVDVYAGAATSEAFAGLVYSH